MGSFSGILCFFLRLAISSRGFTIYTLSILAYVYGLTYLVTPVCSFLSRVSAHSIQGLTYLVTSRVRTWSDIPCHAGTQFSPLALVCMLMKAWYTLSRLAYVHGLTYLVTPVHNSPLRPGAHASEALTYLVTLRVAILPDIPCHASIQFSSLALVRMLFKAWHTLSRLVMYMAWHTLSRQYTIFSTCPSAHACFILKAWHTLSLLAYVH